MKLLTIVFAKFFKQILEFSSREECGIKKKNVEFVDQADLLKRFPPSSLSEFSRDDWREDWLQHSRERALQSS